MGQTRNSPKTILEGFDVELCDLERAVKMLQREKVFWPIYDKARLPRNIVDGNAFITDKGEFCIKLGDSIYCMPAAEFGEPGPVLMRGDLETVLKPDGFSTDNYVPYWIHPTGSLISERIMFPDADT
jgi:hypothetical protein